MQMKLLVVLFILNFTSLSECQSVIIRFDNMDKLYEQQKHVHRSPRRGWSESEEYEIKTRELCSKIVDSIFFTSRHEVNIESTRKHQIDEVKKYYKRFFKSHYRKLYVKRNICFITIGQKEKKVEINCNKLLRIPIGDKIHKEVVFPCLIRNVRSNKLQQIWISRHDHKNRYFLFKQDQNQKFTLLAYVEDVAGSPPENEYLFETLMKKITADQECNELSDNEKMRICNSVINSPITPHKDLKFFPQRANVRVKCRNFDILGYWPQVTELIREYRKREYSKRSVFGCRALRISENKYTIVYTSSFRSLWGLPKNIFFSFNRHEKVEIFEYEKDKGLIIRIHPVLQKVVTTQLIRM